MVKKILDIGMIHLQLVTLSADTDGFMNSDIQTFPGRIHEFAMACAEKIKSAATKREALELIAGTGAAQLDEYSAGTMAEPDEISVRFIEIVDQIVFEIGENMPVEASVCDYIVDDLYSRLNIYLDIFKDRETYAFNLGKRILTHDDTIIMRQCRFAEFVTLLIAEYGEQPALRRSILRALLAFDVPDLLNVYYDIAREAADIEERVLALIGLKKFGDTFNYRRLLPAESEALGALIEYVKSFDCSAIETNEVPRDLYTLFFVLNFIELNIHSIAGPAGCGWIMNVLQSLLSVGYYNSFLPDVYRSMCNIIIFTAAGRLKEVIRNDEHLASLVRVIDFLPREYFQQITLKLSILGNELIQRVNGLLSSGKLELDGSESNTMSYILWKSGNGL